MGREVRRVPPNWDHPKVERCNGQIDFQPMRDRQFEDAAKEWKEGLAAWERKDLEFWEYEGDPPDRAYYRPWKDEDATWYQVWETVSEGTPVTPPFETKDELIDYLVANGDFWDQRRRRDRVTIMDCGPWPRESAERFVKGTGWVPSLIVKHGPDGAEFLTAKNR